jgi:glycosyltransferase involved in cell wall biosynthesis
VNILYLHRTQGAGVEGVHIWEIVRGLRAEGHSVRVLSPAGEATDPRESGPGPREAVGAAASGGGSGRTGLLGRISRHLPELVFELAEIAYNVVALARMSGRFAAVPLDLVFERYAIFSVAGALYARWRGCCWLLEVNYTARSPLVRRRSALLKPLAFRIDRWLFRRADGLVTVSSPLRDELVEVYGIAPERIVVLPNAADPDRFSPQMPAVERISGRAHAGRRVIGFVGGFYPWHGLPLLVEAFARLVDQFDDLLLLLIGDGPERTTVEHLVAERGLTDRVILTGKVDHEGLPAHLATFHVGVMPDSNAYGSPMKIFEYMAMAKPVVVPDYAPLLDAVTDGVEGRVFRRGDVDSLTEALTDILADGDAHRRMGAAARAAVVRVHNWRANARSVLALADRCG